LGPALLIKVI